jgi:hypothetical protein
VKIDYVVWTDNKEIEDWRVMLFSKITYIVVQLDDMTVKITLFITLATMALFGLRNEYSFYWEMK